MGTFGASGSKLEFKATARPSGYGVELGVKLTNRSNEPLEGLELLLCLSSRGASPFPESGHRRTRVLKSEGPTLLDRNPVTGGDPLYLYEGDLQAPGLVMLSTDGGWSLASEFDGTQQVGGNGGSNGTCIHTRPRFARIGAGETVHSRGSIYLGPAGGSPLEQVMAEFQPVDHPRFVSPCSEEGRRRRAALPAD